MQSINLLKTLAKKNLNVHCRIDWFYVRKSININIPRLTYEPKLAVNHEKSKGTIWWTPIAWDIPEHPTLCGSWVSFQVPIICDFCFLLSFLLYFFSCTAGKMVVLRKAKFNEHADNLKQIRATETSPMN